MYKKSISFLSTSFISLIRMALVGVLSVTALIQTMNWITSPDYGVTNIVIIIGSFVFFPTFFILFVEFFFAGLRKKSKKNKKRNQNYMDLQ